MDATTQTVTNPAMNVYSVLGLVLGILSLIVMALFFGPAAIILGAIGGSQGSKMGWVGMSFGIVGLVVYTFILFCSVQG